MKKDSFNYLIPVVLGLVVLGGVFLVDWSDLILSVPLVRADANPGTNIHTTTTDHWAWNDIVGWINFHETHNVWVESKKLSGYASSSFGEIVLNCESIPGSCAAVGDWRTKNRGDGLLSGWAWNDIVGWISFCGTTISASSSNDCPYAAYDYRARITELISEQPPSDFYEFAWNDVVGWIAFNCEKGGPEGSNICGTSNFRVRTDWYPTSTYGHVESAIFDTEVVGGAQFNSVSVKGVRYFGTDIFFQLATSNSSSGPWIFIGPDGTSNTYYEFDYETKSKTYYTVLDYRYHNNYRFFRYKLRLKSDKTQLITPYVDDIIINWSP